MREIYPAEIFEKRKKYNVPVQVGLKELALSKLFNIPVYLILQGL